MSASTFDIDDGHRSEMRTLIPWLLSLSILPFACRATGPADGSVPPAVFSTPPDPPREAWADGRWARRPLACAPAFGTAAPSPARGWSTRPSGTRAGLNRVFGVGPRDVWIVGEAGTLLRTSDHGRTFARCTVDSDENLEGLWASGPDDVWIVGARHLHRIEGGTTVATFSETLAQYCGTGLHDVWGTSARDVWIANGSLVHTTDGGDHWTSHDATCADDVWAAGADVWASGGTFVVDHSANHGETWRSANWTAQTEDDFRVRGSGPDDVWIVARLEGLAHSSDRGATWVDEPFRGSLLVEGKGGPGLHRLLDLYSAGDGWAFVADDGIWVRPGKAPWGREISVDAGLVSVWGTSSADVWAVGDHGLILHRP